VEALCFNEYLNELFQGLNYADSAICPVTVMSVDEFEETLPYVSRNVVGWAELLGGRFNGVQVGALSMHQTIYDLRGDRRVEPIRNEFLHEPFERLTELVKTYYRPPIAS
jgi:hypothetical protein